MAPGLLNATPILTPTPEFASLTPEPWLQILGHIYCTIILVNINNIFFTAGQRSRLVSKLFPSASAS